MGYRKEYWNSYYSLNREKILEKNKKHYIENVEYYKEYGKEWYKQNYKKRIRKVQSDLEKFISAKLTQAKRRAEKYKINYNLEMTDIEIPEICPVFGIPIFVGKRDNKENSPTLDRIIPELGYTKGNVKIISYRANRIKSDATLEELEQIVEYIKREREDKN